MTKDYLQQSFFFFRSNFSALLSIQLPFLIILMIIQMSTISGVDESSNMQAQLILLTGMDMLFVPIYLAATIFYMQAVIDGGSITTTQSWFMAFRCWGRLFLTFVLSALVTALGLMLLIAPGIYIAVRLALANAICVIEGKGPIDSMKESWEGTDGLFWTMFKGLALIFGGLFILEVILSPMVDPSSMISMLISVTLDFLNVLGTIYAYRVYRAWRDKEPVEDKPSVL